MSGSSTITNTSSSTVESTTSGAASSASTSETSSSTSGTFSLSSSSLFSSTTLPSDPTISTSAPSANSSMAPSSGDSTAVSNGSSTSPALSDSATMADMSSEDSSSQSMFDTAVSTDSENVSGTAPQTASSVSTTSSILSTIRSSSHHTKTSSGRTSGRSSSTTTTSLSTTSTSSDSATSSSILASTSTRTSSLSTLIPMPSSIPNSSPTGVTNFDESSNSGFLSNKPAVIGTFTAVGIVVVAILALLFFLCLKRRGGRPSPVQSERSLGSRGIDHDDGLMGYRDSEPNTPSVPGFNHHNDTGALAAGGAGATESVSKGVRFTDATAENRSVDYGLLDDGRYSSEKDGEFGYTGGDGRQATSYSYPSVSSSPSLGSTGLPPRGLSDAYYLGAGGTGGASGSDYTIDPNSSSNSFFPAQSMTSHTSNATTPPATATATSADQWANRALAKSNASALGKEVFSPFQSFQQFENLQQQEPISPRQSSYYRDSQFGDYFSSGGNGDDGAYSGIAIGYASQLSPAASPIPLPLPAQGEKDVDVNINEESDWRKFDGPKPGSPSALGREVFRGFGDRGNDGSSNSAYLFSQNRF